MGMATLHECHVRKPEMIVNRIHTILHGFALLALFYYRITTISQLLQTKETPVLPYVLVFISELVFSFMWALHRPSRWRPVKRTTYPERLPGDDKLPRVDVFICTADPSKEPSVGVMNTVISAMSLDYPTEKIAVYLSDDGGSYVTFEAMKEAWKFAKWWIPFCKKYELKVRCPEAYFSSAESAYGRYASKEEFLVEQTEIEKRYNEFKETLEKNSVNASSSLSRDHPPKIEVINGLDTEDLTQEKMPLLVYVAREKRPSQPHNFKAGALNVLLRVSGIISNAPYFLVLDCDHYCNDPTSARQAMCYYFDPEISPKLGWVQFPQYFHNMSDNDIYDGRLHYYWREWIGLDGIRGPTITGCNFYMKREALYGTEKMQIDVDLSKLEKSFGSSSAFLKSIYRLNQPNVSSDGKVSDALRKELQLVASCTYDINTEWGTEVSYRYYTVVEDSLTSLIFHSKGWISVWVDPARRCFLGSCTTSLNDMLVQQTRWNFGLMQIALSKVSPLVYGILKMSPLQSLAYGALTMDPLYVIPFYGLSLIPQICLFYGLPLYPKVSDPFFFVFAFIFISAQLKFLHDIVSYGDPIRTWLYEYRVWMMKSGACYLYATLNAFLEKLGQNEASFSLTNKDIDDEQAKRHQEGVYDFQVSPQLLVPLCTLYIVNVAAFFIGVIRMFCCHSASELFAQAVIPFFGMVLNYHFLQGMLFRQDNGRISQSVSLLSAGISTIILSLGCLLLKY